MQPDPTSPLDTLRQLQQMLAAGTITQPEFDALKQRLIFGAAPETAAAPPAPTYEEPAAPLPYLDSASALTPEASPLLAPEPDWVPAPATAPVADAPATYNSEPAASAAERRNPLNLVFALGGLLLFLGAMAYLGFQRRPDEHVSSITLTASDTATVAAPEGPQTEQLTLPPAAPETLRVVPAGPPAAVAPEALPVGTDSTAAMPEALPTPTAKTTAPGKPAATKPAAPAAKPAAPAATDTLTGQ